MTKKQVSLPIAVVISIVMAASGAVAGASVVRSDVGYLSDRMVSVEANVETLSGEVEALKVSQATGDARNAERWISVERRLHGIEESLQELLTAARGEDNRRRRR